MKDKIDRLVEPASGWEEDPVEKSKEDFYQVKWLGGIRKIFQDILILTSKGVLGELVLLTSSLLSCLTLTLTVYPHSPTCLNS